MEKSRPKAGAVRIAGARRRRRRRPYRQSGPARRTYWDLEGVYARGDGQVVARHRIRRAAVTLSHGDTDLRPGRQRVAWGIGRFWNPLDLLNPVHPTAPEPGEREGVVPTA